MLSHFHLNADAIAASVEFSAISAELDVLAKSQRENSKAVEAKRENVQILGLYDRASHVAFILSS